MKRYPKLRIPGNTTGEISFPSISFLVKLPWLYHTAAVICEANGKAKFTENLTFFLSSKGTMLQYY